MEVTWESHDISYLTLTLVKEVDLTRFNKKQQDCHPQTNCEWQVDKEAWGD